MLESKQLVYIIVYNKQFIVLTLKYKLVIVSHNFNRCWLRICSQDFNCTLRKTNIFIIIKGEVCDMFLVNIYCDDSTFMQGHFNHPKKLV